MKKARKVSELEIAGKRQEWAMLLAARAQHVDQEERKLGRPLTFEEKSDVEHNTKVPDCVEWLLGDWPKKIKP